LGIRLTQDGSGYTASVSRGHTEPAILHRSANTEPRTSNSAESSRSAWL
jgi:hypothetical protein